MSKSLLYEALARSGQALSSGSRLEILELLAQGERSVQDLSSAAELNLTTTSAHLQVLRQAGLITSRREGTRIIYRLAGDDVAALLVALCQVAEGHRHDVKAERDEHLDDADLRTMNRDELVDSARSGRVVVLDVRPVVEYDAGHLEGAVSIPVDELAGRLSEIPTDVDVAAYCRGRYCVLSRDAVRILLDHDRSAVLLAEGVLEWRSAGVPLTSS